MLDAEQSARELLRADPQDGRALHLLGEVAARAGRAEDAARFLAQALAIEPENTPARLRYAGLLRQQNKLAEALDELGCVLAREPRHLPACDLKASILAQIGAVEEAILSYSEIVQETGSDPFIWVRYGNALRSAGQREACIAAYRKAASLKPDLGEAYCSLANLKTYRFDDTEISRMEEQVARPSLSRESRVAFHFALGRALGEARSYAESFRHYADGNALWRAALTHDAAASQSLVESCRRLFTPEFFAARRAWGCKSAEPIFVVGMPRSGSTLVEQILASHSSIEGAGELPEIMAIATRLDRSGVRYPAVLEAVDDETCRALGAQYLERTRIYRRQGRPHFVDKMPNNFLHIGLIHLILPNSKVVEVSRNAMACCFSNFSHHFARGQQFAYSLDDLGRYYAGCMILMAHYREVLPGTVHRVSYEALVENPERETRALLAFLDLPFESECLRFFASGRPVRSASSEQVRQPLFRTSLETWRHYEPWLDPLKAALGPFAQ